MFRNKSTEDYLLQSGYKQEHLLEKYPRLFRESYGPSVWEFFKRSKKKDYPELERVEGTASASEIIVLSLFLDKKNPTSGKSENISSYDHCKNLEDELRDEISQVAPALAPHLKNSERLIAFAATYGDYVGLESISEEAFKKLLILNTLKLHHVKQDLAQLVDMVISLQGRFKFLRLSELLHMGLDDWSFLDYEYIINRFKLIESTKGTDDGISNYFDAPSVPSMLSCYNSVFALTDNRIHRVVSMSRDKRDLKDALCRTSFYGKPAISDDLAFRLIALSNTVDVMSKLKIRSSDFWLARWVNGVDIGEEGLNKQAAELEAKIEGKLDRYFNKPALPLPLDVTAYRNKTIEIHSNEVIIGEDLFAAQEDGVYTFSDSNPSESTPINIIIRTARKHTIIFDSVNIKAYDYEKPPVHVIGSAMIECYGNVNIEGSTFACGIEVASIEGNTQRSVWLGGEGTLTVSGGSFAPAIGVSGVSQSWGRWTQPWSHQPLYVRIEKLRVITKNTPKHLGIGFYSNQGSTTLEFKMAADTSGIEGYGAQLVKLVLPEPGSTKMSSPLYIADVKKLYNVMESLGLSHLKEEGIEYGGPNETLTNAALKLGSYHLLQELENITISGYTYGQIEVGQDHPLHAQLLACENLGRYMRELKDLQTISSDVNTVD